MLAQVDIMSAQRIGVALCWLYWKFPRCWQRGTLSIGICGRIGRVGEWFPVWALLPDAGFGLSAASENDREKETFNLFNFRVIGSSAAAAAVLQRVSKVLSS